jgi:hypothetical protein
VELRRLRQNKGAGIGSRRKPLSLEELKAHRRMTRQTAGSCGQTWARCGELVAIGELLQLRRAGLLRKSVSMEVLKRCGASNDCAGVGIRAPVQSLAAHATAAPERAPVSIHLNSDIAENTYPSSAFHAWLEH